MRSVSLGLAIGLVAVMGSACGEEATPPPVAPVATVTPPPVAEAPKKEEPKPAPTLAELERKTAEGVSAAINAHDAKKVGSFYADNAVLKMAGMPEVTGREAIIADWQKRFDSFANSKSNASRVFVKGDVVVTEWVWTATHSGEAMGIKASDKPVGAMGADVVWFAPDGLIKEQHIYIDMGTLMSQMGASKHKARAIPAVPTGAPAMVMSTGGAEETKNVEGAQKMFGAFEKKSEADFLSASTDEMTWEDLTQPEAMKGKAAAKKFFTAMTKAFPDLKTTSANTWGIGDFVIGEGAMSGTQKAALFGIPASKKSMTVHGLDVIEFGKDGKIVKGTSYGNSYEMMSQLGHIPGPKADAKAAPAKTDAKPAPAKTDAKPAPAKTDAKPAPAKTDAKPAPKK